VYLKLTNLNTTGSIEFSSNTGYPSGVYSVPAGHPILMPVDSIGTALAIVAANGLPSAQLAYEIVE
jgi:hypothetical protein